MDMLFTMLGGKGMSGLLKTGTAILTTLLVLPALLKLFVVTVDEGWATASRSSAIVRSGARPPGAARSARSWCWTRVRTVRSHCSTGTGSSTCGAERPIFLHVR
jgi:hypothetical protein